VLPSDLPGGTSDRRLGTAGGAGWLGEAARSAARQALEAGRTLGDWMTLTGAQAHSPASRRVDEIARPGYVLSLFRSTDQRIERPSQAHRRLSATDDDK